LVGEGEGLLVLRGGGVGIVDGVFGGNYDVGLAFSFFCEAVSVGVVDRGGAAVGVVGVFEKGYFGCLTAVVLVARVVS